MRATSLDWAARTKAVAPGSKNHCIVKIVRLSVFSLTRALGSAPWFSSSAMYSKLSISGFGTG